MSDPSFAEVVESPVIKSLLAMIEGDRERAIDLIVEHVDTAADAFGWMSGYARAIEQCVPNRVPGDHLVVELEETPTTRERVKSSNVAHAMAAFIGAIGNDDFAGASAVFRSLTLVEQLEALWDICEMAAAVMRAELERRTRDA